MKWTNKGHEYDDMYMNITKKKVFYMFGAGDYGKQFKNMFEHEIELAGYIDNDSNKQGTLINGLPCYKFDEIKITDKSAVILTMSQIARIKAVEQLENAGYKKNEDYFIIEEFISVYYVYKYNKVYFSSVSFLPSTVCNLKCRHCLNFNPFAKKFYVRTWEDIVRDIDLFFSRVDYIMLFHISGGEPMLYKHLADIVEYIDKNYGNKIGTLRTVTNGTVIPNDGILSRLSKCRIEVTVDDYRDAVPQYRENFDKIIDKFNEYGIKYYINKADSWIDLAPERTDYSMMSDEQLQRHRAECNQSWQELRDGKLYSCNYAAYATVAGLAGEQDEEETFDLNAMTPEQKKELIEFRLGYTSKGYTNFCKKCRGFVSSNEVEVMPAEQV